MPHSASNQYNNNKNNAHVHVPNSQYILIVDDEPDILSIIRRVVEEYGFNVCCFTKPNIALEHYKVSPNNHRLVISDLQMPNINGLEFLRKVREINSDTKTFLTTSNFEMSDLGLLLLPNNSNSYSSLNNLTIDEFIQKPFSIEQLIVLIRKHIRST
jgi:two-component system C4-dicarboxylate transport response regulator DctD